MRRAITIAALLALAGCGSPCQDLANRICGCQPAGSPQDACKSQVTQQLAAEAQKPGSADESFCAGRLNTCHDPGSDSGMCDRLQTEQGKIDCGLAFPAPTP